MSPVAPWHVESSWTRDRTGVPCTARWILYWSTREARSLCHPVQLLKGENNQALPSSEAMAPWKGLSPCCVIHCLRGMARQVSLVPGPETEGVNPILAWISAQPWPFLIQTDSTSRELCLVIIPFLSPQHARRLWRSMLTFQVLFSPWPWACLYLTLRSSSIQPVGAVSFIPFPVF